MYSLEKILKLTLEQIVICLKEQKKLSLNIIWI